MSQVEYFAERSFAIKGTLVFTAQRDQFTIMEDAYLVCDGKKVAGTYSALPEQYRQIKVLDASGKFVIPGTCDIHVHADSGTHGSSVMRSQTSLDLTIQRMRN